MACRKFAFVVHVGQQHEHVPNLLLNHRRLNHFQEHQAHRCSTVGILCTITDEYYEPTATMSMFALSQDTIAPDNALLLRAPPVALIVLGAIALFALAQGFINSLMEGDRGLGAFLSDGEGYSRSAFKPRSKLRSDKAQQDSSFDAPLGGPDPLPWLKLPRLEFVEVAGQEGNNENGGLDPQEEVAIIARLEELADLLTIEVKAGNTEEANRLRNQLQSLMTKYGFEYQSGMR